MEYFEVQRDWDFSKSLIQNYLNEISKTNLSSAKQMLYRIVEQQTQSLMLANAREEYAFKVIDPARKPIHPSGPNRRITVVIGFVFGVFSSVFLTLLYHYFRNIKKVTS